ncbi:MAG: hypothetical protein KY439_10975 [Actinobacteria bacterium]|nr:hypothetical protein [Actinomycetota bacterium]
MPASVGTLGRENNEVRPRPLASPATAPVRAPTPLPRRWDEIPDYLPDYLVTGRARPGHAPADTQVTPRHRSARVVARPQVPLLDRARLGALALALCGALALPSAGGIFGSRDASAGIPRSQPAVTPAIAEARAEPAVPSACATPGLLGVLGLAPLCGGER